MQVGCKFKVRRNVEELGKVLLEAIGYRDVKKYLGIVSVAIKGEVLD